MVFLSSASRDWARIPFGWREGQRDHRENEGEKKDTFRCFLLEYTCMNLEWRDRLEERERRPGTEVITVWAVLSQGADRWQEASQAEGNRQLERDSDNRRGGAPAPLVASSLCVTSAAPLHRSPDRTSCISSLFRLLCPSPFVYWLVWSLTISPAKSRSLPAGLWRINTTLVKRPRQLMLAKASFPWFF